MGPLSGFAWELNGRFIGWEITDLARNYCLHSFACFLRKRSMSASCELPRTPVQPQLPPARRFREVGAGCSDPALALLKYDIRQRSPLMPILCPQFLL
jgi:hypothetical protein